MQEEGFTLVEILIAITIASIILTSVFSFFNLGFSTWEKRKEDKALEQEWRVVDQFLKRDLHNLFTSDIYNNRFLGDYHGFEGIILTEKGLSKIRYQYNPAKNQLLRQVIDLEKDKLIEETLFLADINLRDLEFSFYDSKNQYWKSDWEYRANQGLPLAVKLELRGKDIELPALVIDIYIEQKY
ncbi:hypothetical protein U472_08195 [Orenia metallireducens]|jgi:general secretion pathway protein J|uniref:Type II secretion system protein J n=1 Tax=Orenia metallireducens TaxID=1413210 RepID=A0A1C0A707_9FIRM|nr:prepilin-type N-terminal cleavage/methylation domain-containing protein [Orenia metallireducens]OCL25998.1 hypothetical protein U472_08195 [Orenia metallireducens]